MFRESPLLSCTKFYSSFQAGAKVNWRRDFSKAPEQICGKARKRTQQKSWLPVMFILLLLILPLQINWDIRIHPLLYHWSALQPLAKCPRQPWKVQPNEWFSWQKFRCKMSGLPGDAKWVSEQADGWRAGLQQVRSHQRHRWGCWLLFGQPQTIFTAARGKGPNPGRVQIVTLSTAQREFRKGLHEPSGGQRGQPRTDDSRSQVFQLGQAMTKGGIYCN